MGAAPPRYSTRPFPAYAYVPGRDPHPTRDPRGHSFSASAGERPALSIPPARWRDSEAYLFGADLYNHGYLWEAHEAWEGLWHASKGNRVQADFLQGLIQCAAAALKLAMAQPQGSLRLAELGTERLDRVAREVGPVYMGLDVPAFAAELRAFAAAAPHDAEARPRIRLE